MFNLIELTDVCRSRKCGYCLNAIHPALPTRPLTTAPSPEKMKETAVLIIGEAPGWQEDREGTSWIGISGQLLTKFIYNVKLPDLADIYLSNTLRCRPPAGSKPTVAKAKHCLHNTLSDIESLNALYPHVVLFLQGALAAKTFIGCSKLTDAFNRQAQHAPTLPGNPIVFVTYHPAHLLGGSKYKTGRKPQLIAAVELHWTLIATYLKDPAAFLSRKSPITYTLNPGVEDFIGVEGSNN